MVQGFTIVSADKRFRRVAAGSVDLVGINMLGDTLEQALVKLPNA
jgi:hypothetical protein